MADTSQLHTRHRQVMPSWLTLYYQEPIEFVSGSGRRLTDSRGKTYLDFFAGILTNMLGYDVAEVRAAVDRQLASGIVHTSTLYLIRAQVELAERIAGLSGIANPKVFFTNSGTEANETALMLATQARGSNQVIALRNSYHGRAFATVGITGIRSWSASALRPVQVSFAHNGERRPGSAYAGLSDDELIRACVEDLANVIDTSTSGQVACLIAEPIQGVGGFTRPPGGLLGAYQKILDEYGILLISDEVQTGWGRTGEHFWGYQAHGARPDALTFAKGLGNGFAIGGVVARAELMDCLQANSISTFGGNPLAMTAASATLEYLLSHDLQANAHKQGTRLLEGLRSVAETSPVVGEIRGKGLMIAVELVEPGTTVANPTAASQAMEATRRAGLLVGKGGPAGNVLRIAPPMTLTDDEAAEGLEILTSVLTRLGDEVTA